MPTAAAVVIPCRNEALTITRLLDDLAAQTTRPSEIIVVDDGSTDGTAANVDAWIHAHPSIPVTLVRGSGRGAAAAMNAGIERASAAVIVRLDGHCRPDRAYIERSLAALALPRAGVAGGGWRIQAGSDSLVSRGIAAVLSHPLASGGARYRTPGGSTDVEDVDTVPFGAFRRDLWKQLGGFDESLMRNQDYDFNYRARLAGLRVVLDPAIVSVYTPRPTMRALARQYFDYGYWKVVMLRKYPESLRLRQLLPILLLPAVLGSVIASAVLGTPRMLWILVAYLAVNVTGAVQVSARSRDVRLVPFAATALMVLQNAWSAGAWSSLIRGVRARRA